MHSIKRRHSNGNPCLAQKGKDLLPHLKNSNLNIFAPNSIEKQKNEVNQFLEKKTKIVAK